MAQEFLSATSNAIKEEVMKLQQERKDYNETIHTLGVWLRQEIDSTREKTSQLESKLSPEEKLKYAEIQMRSFEDQLEYLHFINTELSTSIAQSLCRQRDLLQDIEELQKLLREAIKKCKVCEALITNHSENGHEVAYVLNRPVDVHQPPHLYLQIGTSC